MLRYRRVGVLWVIVLLCVFVGGPHILQAQTAVQVKTTTDINLRSGPQINSKIIAVLTVGTTLPAIGRNQDGSWIQVNSVHGAGWVTAAFLISSGDLKSLPVTNSPGTPAAAGGGAPAVNMTATVGADGISVRDQPSESGDELDVLDAGTTVVLTGRQAGSPLWVRFSFQGQDAWLAGWLLTIHGNPNTLPVVTPATPEPDTTNELDPDLTDEATGSDQPAGTAGLVLDNQFATTVHFVVQGPMAIDVNLGPHTSRAFTVPPGTYVLSASAEEYDDADNRTVTLAAGHRLTWHVTTF